MDSVVISIQPYMVRVFGSVEYTTYRLEDKPSFDRFMELLKQVDGCNDDDYCLILFDELLDREKRIRYRITDGAPIDQSPRDECAMMVDAPIPESKFPSMMSREGGYNVPVRDHDVLRRRIDLMR